MLFKPPCLCFCCCCYSSPRRIIQAPLCLLLSPPGTLTGQIPQSAFLYPLHISEQMLPLQGGLHWTSAWMRLPCCHSSSPWPFPELILHAHLLDIISVFFLICLPQQQRKYVEGEAWQSFSTSASAVLRRASGYLIYICLSKEEKKSKKKGWEEERKEEKTDNRKRGVRKKKEATERNLSTAIWVILDMSFISLSLSVLLDK